ncbi:MAG: DEAD/DEAH box helicase family protein [Planctomycetaceae bacterium]|nr:DEAD/DEAH box helicase family protein [Planctomycetaceae bacterium]
MLELRDYQKRSLDALESYLRLTVQHGAKTAFVVQTERPYRAVPQLPELPYLCLRIPTGGGKTLMACHALGIATKEYLQAERAVCLWLVPSNTIRDQTLAALRDRQHPYRQAVDAHFGGLVTVMDLTEALYVTRGTLAGETCIIVATLAALRVEDTEGRKVYESSGALMDHFSGLSAELEALLERNGNGIIPYSLCNVLRLWRPVVIMDEAHNARTQLSFDTLARFNPSCIVEFTATPETTHKPEKGQFASNILHHVSAAELKAEDMVKLPIKLETRSEWKEVLAEALKTQRTLEGLALDEEKQTGEYIRPIVLLQAQPKHKDKETLTVEVVRQSLIDDFHIPEDQIAVATGQTREIDDVDLFARDCPIRFIITVAALKEGWDCSFAYVLCSVAEIGSARAVEQVLGRVLRLPRATRKRHAELNCAYAIAASRQFIEAATSLKDALVDNGFQRMEAELFVASEQTQATFFGAGTLFFEAKQVVSEQPDLTTLPAGLQERVTFDPQTQTLTVTKYLTEQDKDELDRCFSTPEGKQSVEAVFRLSRGQPAAAQPPADRGPFRVPMLAIRVDNQLELFEEGHFLDVGWRLSQCDAGLSEAEFPSEEYVSGTAGEIDVTDQGKVEVHFVDQIHRQLRLLGMEPGWDTAGLTNWLDRQIHHPDIVRTESTLFIYQALTGLVQSRGLTIEKLAGEKFRLRTALADKIDQHRRAAAVQAFQRTLFSATPAVVEVGPEIVLEYMLERYAPNWYYDGSYRFHKHYFPLVGELRSEGEEFQCAVFLDQLDTVKWWLRNLERRSEFSFWLQTSTDKFYPDFVALLTDGRILVVEFKGEHLWSNDDSKEKRAVGDLWADRSNGTCLFVMPKGTDWGAIQAKLN